MITSILTAWIDYDDPKFHRALWLIYTGNRTFIASRMMTVWQEYTGESISAIGRTIKPQEVRYFQAIYEPNTTSSYDPSSTSSTACTIQYYYDYD